MNERSLLPPEYQTDTPGTWVFRSLSDVEDWVRVHGGPTALQRELGLQRIGVPVSRTHAINWLALNHPSHLDGALEAHRDADRRAAQAANLARQAAALGIGLAAIAVTVGFVVHLKR